MALFGRKTPPIKKIVAVPAWLTSTITDLAKQDHCTPEALIERSIRGILESMKLGPVEIYTFNSTDPGSMMEYDVTSVKPGEVYPDLDIEQTMTLNYQVPSD